MPRKNILTVVVAALLTLGTYAAPPVSRKTHSVVRKPESQEKNLKKRSVKSHGKKHGKFGRIMKGIFKGLFRHALGIVDPSLPNAVLPAKHQASASPPLKRVKLRPKAPRRQARTKNRVTLLHSAN